MIEKERINGSQFMCLVSQYTIGSAILITPSGLAQEAKQDAWIAALLGVVMGLILVLLYMHIGKLYPNMTLIQMCEKIFGKWIGKTISLMFFSFSFLLTALVLRNIGDFMTTKMLAETPQEIILIFFLTVVIFGAKLGLEAIARTAEVFWPWVFVPFIILIIFLSPEMEIQKIQPVFEEGIKPIARASIPFIGIPFLELIVFLMVFPFINRSKEAAKGFFMGTLIGGITIVIITITCILVLGHSVTGLETFPTYHLGKKINIGNFLERIEAVVGIIWIITIYFKLVILFYATALGLSQIFNLREYRFLLFPLGMIIVVLSLIAYPSVSYFQNFIAKIWTPYALTYGFFLPLLLVLVAVFQKVEKDGKE